MVTVSEVPKDTEDTDPHVLGGAATCSKGFVLCFLKVPLACLGSMAAAVQLNSLGNSWKTFYKTLGTSCCPRLYLHDKKQ